jgi:gliding motility-associated protein GldL
MNAYNKYKNRLEKHLQTERGKRFINFAYSFGAAIVILGAMFKLLHFPFGNEMLFIGMITEVVVFMLSAFDTPARDYPWEQVFPVLSTNDPRDRSDFTSGSGQNTATAAVTPNRGTQQAADNVSHSFQYPETAPGTQPGSYSTSRYDPRVASPGNSQRASISSLPESGIDLPQNLSSHAEEYGKQMESLNRTLSGLNTIYDIQLKSISGQIDTIEQINRGLTRLKGMYSDTIPDGSVIKEETEKMAFQLKELNEVYARMLHAMTVNRGGNATYPHSGSNPNP